MHHCFSTFFFHSQTVNLSAVMQHPPQSLFPLVSRPFLCDSVFFMLHLGITAREHPGHSLTHPLLHSLTIGQALKAYSLSNPLECHFQSPLHMTSYPVNLLFHLSCFIRCQRYVFAQRLLGCSLEGVQ